MCLYYCEPEFACYDNDNDALIPEQWAYEGLARLEENMVIANLVHRDFEPTIANYGDVVNAHRPGEFKIRRKSDATSSLDHQNANATKVPVKLDQWFYTSFVIKDGEQSYSFKDLVQVYLAPAMETQARSVDRSVLGQFHRFLGAPADRAGRLGNLLPSDSHEVVLDAREKLNTNKAPTDANRHLVLSSASETALLKNDMFISAEKRGDGGTALENARLGHILGFNTYLAQNTPYVNSLAVDVVTGTLTAGSNAGATLDKDSTGACTVTGYVAEPGEFVTIAGDDQPKIITALNSGGGDTTGITVNEALKYAVEDSAPVTVYKYWTTSADYETGHYDPIVIDSTSFTNPPQIGQMVAFGTGGSRHEYTIIEAEPSGSDYKIWLDRPLEAPVDGDPTPAKVFPGPAGSFNLAFHRNALALVNRPLAVPSGQTGVLSGVGMYNGIAMRVSMQYDIGAGGTVVNCDMLAGVGLLDSRLGVVVLG